MMMEAQQPVTTIQQQPVTTILTADLPVTLPTPPPVECSRRSGRKRKRVKRLVMHMDKDREDYSDEEFLGLSEYEKAMNDLIGPEDSMEAPSLKFMKFMDDAAHTADDDIDEHSEATSVEDIEEEERSMSDEHSDEYQPSENEDDDDDDDDDDEEEEVESILSVPDDSFIVKAPPVEDEAGLASGYLSDLANFVDDDVDYDDDGADETDADFKAERFSDDEEEEHDDCVDEVSASSGAWANHSTTFSMSSSIPVRH